MGNELSQNTPELQSYLDQFEKTHTTINIIDGFNDITRRLYVIEHLTIPGINAIIPDDRAMYLPLHIHIVGRMNYISCIFSHNILKDNVIESLNNFSDDELSFLTEHGYVNNNDIDKWESTMEFITFVKFLAQMYIGG